MRQLTTRGVRMKTAESEVFLGHREPDRAKFGPCY